MKFAERNIGLCLSSGLFGFYAHCGFMKAMEEQGMKPRAITGSSAGAILGGLWAAGLSAASIESILLDVGVRDFLDPPPLRELLNGPFALTRGKRIEKKLEAYLPVQRFEQCPIPFAVNVFDLATAELRIVDQGPLARGIRASASLPGLLQPTMLDGHPCWDGAISEKIPIAPLLKRDDIDLIVICYLARKERELPPRSFMGGMRLALDTLVYESDRAKLRQALETGIEVVVIAPEVPRCGPHKMHEGARIIELARNETRRILEEEDFGCEELEL